MSADIGSILPIAAVHKLAVWALAPAARPAATVHGLEGHLCVVPAQARADLQVEILQVEVCWVTKLVGATPELASGGVLLALLVRQLVATPFWILPVAVPATVGHREDPADACFGDPRLARCSATGAAKLKAGPAAFRAPAEHRIGRVKALAVQRGCKLRQGPPTWGHGVREAAAARALGHVVVAVVLAQSLPWCMGGQPEQSDSLGTCSLSHRPGKGSGPGDGVGDGSSSPNSSSGFTIRTPATTGTGRSSFARAQPFGHALLSSSQALLA
eukprot:CAMPEP_0179079150 /NCGR_PEP_ID=MMETSP0796-20121207/35495_1 /TAXON_ID=73915 /ORGANISM="Pyrodinium bahamense, Strain pbaha01" /LENGTH=271 /DNA_ID=CAMNT_0020776479 /DNA_START=47 /DNA_END=860 /DNA_ORIENTATION=+